METPPPDSCSLYLVSPPRIALGEFLPRAEAAFASPIVKAFQLRLKEAGDAEILNAAAALLPLARARGIAFILNDRPDLARQAGADGVHLGQDDMGVAEARAILGNEAVIGVSCHASRHLAMEAAEAGADYVAFGAFYPTKSKPMEKIRKWGVPPLDILTWWSELTTIPCVAIGGVTPENCGALARAGTDFVAAITSVWEHPAGVAAALAAYEKELSVARRG